MPYDIVYNAKTGKVSRVERHTVRENHSGLHEIAPAAYPAKPTRAREAVACGHAPQFDSDGNSLGKTCSCPTSRRSREVTFVGPGEDGQEDALNGDDQDQVEADDSQDVSDQPEQNDEDSDLTEDDPNVYDCPHCKGLLDLSGIISAAKSSASESRRESKRQRIHLGTGRILD